jgi:hypothetical protein
MYCLIPRPYVMIQQTVSIVEYFILPFILPPVSPGTLKSCVSGTWGEYLGPSVGNGRWPSRHEEQ